MGLFNRKRRDEESPVDPNDPLTALARAEKALEKAGGWGSDGEGHYGQMNPQMSEALAKVREQLESGGGSLGSDPRFAPTPTSSSSRPIRASRSAQPPLVEDPITKVERLAKLLEDGALTQEEFQEQKRKALDEG